MIEPKMRVAIVVMVPICTTWVKWMSGMSSLRVEIVTTIRYNAVRMFRVGTIASFGSSVVIDHPSVTVWTMRIAAKSRRRTNLTRRI